MKRFDFSKLAGGVKPKAMDDTEDEQAMDPPAEDEEAASAEEDEQAEDAAPEDGAMDDAEEETAAVAYRRGRRAERARCAAILAEAGPHNVALAASLAFNSSITPEQAKAALATAPKGSRLAAAMAGHDKPLPAAGGGADDTPSAQASRILAHAGRLKQEA